MEVHIANDMYTLVKLIFSGIDLTQYGGAPKLYHSSSTSADAVPLGDAIRLKDDETIMYFPSDEARSTFMVRYHTE